MKEIFTSFFRHICDFLSKRLFNRNFCHAPLKIWFLFLLFICKFQQSLKTIWYKNAFDKWRMSTTHFHLVATNSPWVLSCFWQLSKACGITWWWGNSQLRNWVRYDGGTFQFLSPAVCPAIPWKHYSIASPSRWNRQRPEKLKDFSSSCSRGYHSQQANQAEMFWISLLKSEQTF